jgi:hypothetical protein
MRRYADFEPALLGDCVRQSNALHANDPQRRHQEFAGTCALLSKIFAKRPFFVIGSRSTSVRKRPMLLPGLMACAVFALSVVLANRPTQAATPQPLARTTAVDQAQPFVAQVVGLEWLNPLQRRDYPTEWQLLWTLGLAKPNRNDDMVRTHPEAFSSLKSVAIVADGNNERKPLEDFITNTLSNYCCFSVTGMRRIRITSTRWRHRNVTDINYVVYDAGKGGDAASERIGSLSQTLTESLPEFNYQKQTFNTPGLLGNMGAGTALTNVALAISHANHLGGSVLVAGTTDPAHPVAVVVTPPSTLTPINPNQDWFRARGENNAYLPWWGKRPDTNYGNAQGYSY